MSSVYYPSALAQLHIRLQDDIGEIPSEVLAVLRGEANAFSSAEGLMAFANPSRDDPYSHIVNIIPQRYNLELNGYRVADRLTLNLAWRDLPLKPEMIRALGVSFFAGTVRADEFSKGINAPGGDIRRAFIDPTNKDNRRFLGFCDDLNMVTSEGGVITLHCTDFITVLAGQRIPLTTLRELDMNQPLDRLIKQLLEGFPGGACEGLKVQSYKAMNPKTGLFQDLPTLASDSVGTEATKARRGRKRRKGASRGGLQISFWDQIADWCVRSGVVPVLRQDTLWLLPPRTLYRNETLGGFARTVVEGGKAKELRIRRMVQGFNLRNLRINRRFGKANVPTIVVISYVPELGKRLIAHHPPQNLKLRSRGFIMTPSGKRAGSKHHTVVIRGIKDQALLERIAENIYEEIGRRQIGGSFSTFDLASWGGDNNDADLYDLQSGDPVEIVARGPDGTSPFSDFMSEYDHMPPDQQRRELEKKGMERIVAQSLVNLYQKHRNLQTVFRVREVRISGDMSGANPSTEVSVTFNNFIELKDSEIKADVRQELGEKLAVGPSRIINLESEGGNAAIGDVEVEFLRDERISLA